MSSDWAIQVDGLSKCYHIYEQPHHRLLQMLCRGRVTFYREFWALHDVRFTVGRGETVGIIGRNGSGKSTLLQLICGTLNQTHGAVTTRGRVAALLELGSGFNPEFTGRENVFVYGKILGLTDQQMQQRLNAVLAFADIGDFVDQPIKTYSSGMVVRLAFAVIAHVDADILVIDEALAVGDAFFTQKCMAFLRQFMKTGTVLFVSHDTASVRGLCSRAIWLEHGRIIEDGSPKHVCERYLEAYYENQQGQCQLRADIKASANSEPALPGRDQRSDLINQSTLRNDFRVFAFDATAASFGLGKARIRVVHLADTSDRPLAWVVGGERVSLKVVIEVLDKLESPIVGFFVKDRLGQTLFGDNTYLAYLNKPLRCEPRDTISVSFVFDMPILPTGDYCIAVAVASGTPERHEQHHWIHDALLFRSETSSISTGLVGLPMLKIDMTLRGEEAN